MIIYCLCLNKIVVYYFQSIVNPCVVQKQVESQLYRNGTDIAAVYNGLAESVAHFDEFCIIYCCMVNTVVISMSMIGIKTPRHENKFIKIVNGKALQLP